MSLIDNKILDHKNFRWVAAGTYFAGLGMIFSHIEIVQMLGLVVWIIPVLWTAHMYAKHGF